MENAVVYGFGKNFFLNKNMIEKNYHICGIVDMDSNKHGIFNGYEISPLDKLASLKFDYILITPTNSNECVNSLLRFGIEKRKIRILFDKKLNSWNHCFKSFTNDGVMTAYFDGLKFSLKTLSDHMVMEGIFLGDFWHFAPPQGAVVFDIGMNVGISTLFFAGLESVKKVIGVEPFLKSYECALDNIALNDNNITSKIRTYNVGLGDEGKTISAMYDETYTTNLRTDEKEFDAHGPLIKVTNIQIRNASEFISNVISRLNLTGPFVLKINCEGAEYGILESLDKSGLIKKIKIMMIATHDGRQEEAYTILKRNDWVYFPTQITNDGHGWLNAVNLADY